MSEKLMELNERCNILKKQLMLIGNDLSKRIEGQKKWTTFQKFLASKLVWQLSEEDVVRVAEGSIEPKRFRLEITPVQFGINISDSCSDVKMEWQIEDIMEKLNSISPIIKFEYTGLDIKELRNTAPITFYVKWSISR